MSDAIKHLRVIHNNPFILAPLFPAFFGELPGTPKSILLSYLVLPLALYPASKNFLIKARATSSVRTLCQDRERLYALAARINEYKELTNTCIQYALDVKSISLGKNLAIELNTYKLDEDICPVDSIKAAKGLGKLCAPLEVPAVYRMLGVKKL